MDLLYGSKNDRTSQYNGSTSAPETTYTASSTPSVMKSHALLSSALSRTSLGSGMSGGGGRPTGGGGGGGASGGASGGSGGGGEGDGGMIESPGAYERLILEVMRGDQTNFVHRDELLCSWRIFTPALHELASNDALKPEIYKFGSPGPKSELAFSQRFGFPKGFAHDVDHDKKTQAIAWGRSTGNSDGGSNQHSRASSPSRV
jgi:hypothetical protein